MYYTVIWGLFIGRQNHLKAVHRAAYGNLAFQTNQLAFLVKILVEILPDLLTDFEFTIKLFK